MADLRSYQVGLSVIARNTGHWPRSYDPSGPRDLLIRAGTKGVIYEVDPDRGFTIAVKEYHPSLFCDHRDMQDEWRLGTVLDRFPGGLTLFSLVTHRVTDENGPDIVVPIGSLGKVVGVLHHVDEAEIRIEVKLGAKALVITCPEYAMNSGWSLTAPTPRPSAWTRVRPLGRGSVRTPTDDLHAGDAALQCAGHGAIRGLAYSEHYDPSPHRGSRAEGPP